jgi:hypothetical protein
MLRSNERKVKEKDDDDDNTRPGFECSLSPAVPLRLTQTAGKADELA